MSSYSASKRPYFTAANESGLASIGSGDNNHALFATKSAMLRQHHQMGYYYSVSSPRSVSGRFYDARFGEPEPHFLESCFLCNKPLAHKDIFMYRGDIPFCSEECRQEQIEIDEAKEKNMNLSSSVKALRNKEQRRSSSPTKGQDYSFHAGTINAAA